MKKALFALAMLTAFIVVAPMITNVQPYRIGSGSMEPTLPTGSLILVKQGVAYDTRELITFRADDGEVVTHRLMAYGEGGTLITKGDANPTSDVWDAPLTKSDVIGKVIYMTPVTTLAFWTSPRGLAIIALLAVIIALSRWRVDEESEDEAQAAPYTYTPA